MDIMKQIQAMTDEEMDALTDKIFGFFSKQKREV